jgi:hypothetical protein
MKENEDLKAKISPLVNDVHWVYVEAIIKKHMEKLLDFNDINLSQNGSDIKGEMLARKKAVSVLKTSLAELGIFKYVEPVVMGSNR